MRNARIPTLVGLALFVAAMAVPPGTAQAQLATGLYTVNSSSCIPEDRASIQYFDGYVALASGYTHAYLRCPLPHVGGGQYNILELVYGYTATGWDGGVTARLRRVADSTGTASFLATVAGLANATSPRLQSTSFSHTFSLADGSYYVLVELSREVSTVVSPRFYTVRLTNFFG